MPPVSPTPVDILPTFDNGTYKPSTATNPPTAIAPTLDTPTPDTRNVEALCFDLDRNWGKDWPSVIDILDRLRSKEGQCDGKDPLSLLYPAYYNYGVWLEARGDNAEAIDAYQKALSANAQGIEAAEALKKYNVVPVVPLTICSNQRIHNALNAVPLYVVQGKSRFVQIQQGTFTLDGQTFHLRGVNYYPVRAPWRRFLTDTDLAVAASELDLIRAAGLNTLRIFLWYDALFECPGNGAVPKADAFARLDAVLRLAAARDLHVIVTLNDLPDLSIRPLYSYPEAAAAQTAYIVNRYRDEPAILAWDLRNEGDIDYTRQKQSPTVVLNWLNHTSQQVRRLDPNHLITAGWLSNAQVTDSAVDFLSFHHWSTPDQLRQRIAAFHAATSKPILLEEVGYSTLGVSEDQQSALLHDVLTAADNDGLAGWVIWTAFDFPTDVTCLPPACPSQDNGEHHFGLWHVDYTQKPVVEMLKSYTEP